MKLRGLTLGLAALALATPQLAQAQSNAAKPAPRPAQPAQSAQPQLRVPEAATLLILIRSTIEALNQANLTNNYSVLYLMGSDNFRRSTNPQNLATAFAPFREKRISLYPSLVIGPQLSTSPVLQNGRLTLTGFVPSSPARINFTMQFEAVQGNWKLLGLNVTLSANPQAQTQTPAQPQRQP